MISSDSSSSLANLEDVNRSESWFLNERIVIACSTIAALGSMTLGTLIVVKTAVDSTSFFYTSSLISYNFALFTILIGLGFLISIFISSCSR